MGSLMHDLNRIPLGQITRWDRVSISDNGNCVETDLKKMVEQHEFKLTGYRRVGHQPEFTYWVAVAIIAGRKMDLRLFKEGDNSLWLLLKDDRNLLGSGHGKHFHIACSTLE
jgi:hypothetical protein